MIMQTFTPAEKNLLYSEYYTDGSYSNGGKLGS